MNPWLTTFLLAVVQGIGEFLPISSSGHLVILSAIMGLEEASSEMTIVLHAGTLGSILVFYWKRILRLLNEDRRVIGLLVWGTIPAVIAGWFIKVQYEWVTANALVAGFCLPVTGLMLLLLTRLDPIQSKTAAGGESPSGKRRPSGEYQQMRWWQAVIVGSFQALALAPGISRSGATIFAGSLVGLRQQSATTFSFLLAIPAILGACVLEFKDILVSGSTTPPWILAMGAAVAFAIGLIALKLLVHWVERNRLHLFAYWVIPLGLLTVLWQLYLLAR